VSVSDAPGAERPNNEASAQQQQTSPDWRPSDYSNVAIAVLTAVLGALAILQLRLMARTNRHLQVVERAYITMSHVPPGLTGDVLQLLGPLECARWDISIGVKVENAGNTPARVTGSSLDVVALKLPLPDRPMYAIESEPRDVFIVKGQSFHIYANVNIDGRVIDEVRARPDEMVFLALGYVDYIDRFDRRHRLGYARFYSPSADRKESYSHGRAIFGRTKFESRNNLPFLLKSGYNYDRERKPDEGSDWD
jgi:hypothetical protein